MARSEFLAVQNPTGCTILDPLNVCRICLRKSGRLVNIFTLDDKAKWLEDIKKYYRITLSLYDCKSTKLCRKCMRHVTDWHKNQEQAIYNQTIIDFFHKRTHGSSCRGITIKEEYDA